MACFTRDIRVQAGQRKGSLAVIEAHLLPAARAMTSRAIRAKLTLMRIVRRMARETILRCALIHSIFMAARTGYA